MHVPYTPAEVYACVQVGIFDADVYGPSLPLMVDPAVKVLEMDAATKAIYPTEYEGVKVRPGLGSMAMLPALSVSRLTHIVPGSCMRARTPCWTRPALCRLTGVGGPPVPCRPAGGVVRLCGAGQRHHARAHGVRPHTAAADLGRMG